MVLCAALRLHNDKAEYDIVIPCWRHATGYAILRDVGLDYHIYDITEGFITTKNEFLTRKEAYDHCRACDQLPYQLILDKRSHGENELFSEDLY